MTLVDEFVWGEYELEKKHPRRNTKKRRQTHARESWIQQPPTPYHHGHHGEESREKSKREHSPHQGGRSKPLSSPTRAGGIDLQVLPTGCAMLAKRLATHATTPIGNVQLGKKVKTTQNLRGHHQSVGPAKKKSSK